MSIIDRIAAARAAGEVQRFHTVRTIVPETVGEHSFNVVNLILLMTGGHCSRSLLIAAIVHDMGEIAVGDVPSPIKKMYPQEVQDALDRQEEDAIARIYPYLVGHKQLTEEEAKTLKLADNIDGMLKCRQEIIMGNRTLRQIGDRYVDYIHHLTDKWDTHRIFAEEAIHYYRGVLG